MIRALSIQCFTDTSACEQPDKPNNDSGTSSRAYTESYPGYAVCELPDHNGKILAMGSDKYACM